MKILFIFGKGIDGCGVTRGTILFEEWLVQHGHTAEIISFDNGQGMGRANDVKFQGRVSKVSSKEEEVSQEIIDLVNNADIAIFHSYPTKKQWEYVERFRRFMEKIDGPIVVMHDHGVSASTINAVPQAGELFTFADVLVAQSMTGLSVDAFSGFDPGLKGRCLENPIWLKPRGLDEFDKSFEERRLVLNYTGRFSSLKQTSLIPKIAPLIYDKGWRCEMIGVEKSFGAMGPGGPYQPEFQHYTQFWRKTKKGFVCVEYQNFLPKSHQDPPIFAQDRYEHAEGMKALGSSMASWCGYRLLDPENYGARMEYTQIEAFLLTVPIISKSFASEAKSPEGKNWGEYDCALVSNLGEEEELSSRLIELSANRGEWEDRRQACRELIFKFNDIEKLAPDFLNTVLKLGRRKHDTGALERMVEWWPNVMEHRAAGDIIMTHASALKSRRKLILTGRKQTEV